MECLRGGTSSFLGPSSTRESLSAPRLHRHRYDKKWISRPQVKAVLGVERGFEGESKKSVQLQRLALASLDAYATAEQRVMDAVITQVRLATLWGDRSMRGWASGNPAVLEESYERCGEVTAEYAKTFYLGTKLMTPERQRAIWAIYVWCRRTDELVDGPNAPHITPEALDRWEQRLDDIFSGNPYDMLDAALADTVLRYPLHIQPFRDMVDGMRMDLVKQRYATFDELYLYCYNVAGTVGLMSTPIMGIAPDTTMSTEQVYKAALALGIANQLTNILRDVGEDSRRGRIYVPLEELAQFGLGEEDIFRGEVTEKWREFMKFQIKRAREYFAEAEAGVVHLDKDSRLPVWASLILYRQILDAIEANDYDNFHKRAYVSKAKKLLSLPYAYLKAQMPVPHKAPAKLTG